MTYTAVGVQKFLATTEPFNSLPSDLRERLFGLLQPLRYRMGQSIWDLARLIRHGEPSEGMKLWVVLRKGQIVGVPNRAVKERILFLNRTRGVVA